MISGEPVPVKKQEGDKVIGATVNTTGSLTMRAEKVGHDTLLAQIVKMVADAQRSRAPIQKLADIVAVSDPIKDSTPDAIKQLHEEGLRVVMLTGDNKATADAVAANLGIDAVLAEILPDEKTAEVKRLQDEGRISCYGR